MFPSNTEYAIIVQNLSVFIEDDYVKNGIPIKNGIRVVSYTGGFSKVFPITVSNKRVALRFWTKEVDSSRERYREIDYHLKKTKLPYFVDFHYIEDKLVWEGNKYPFIYMDWVEGTPLHKYIDKNIQNSNKIRYLAKSFFTMMQDLHINRIAHGDLQEENILIVEKNNAIELKLIDYDTVFVPKLKNFSMDIMGVEAYQHPKKNAIKHINEKIDYFSELVIYLSLLTYSEDTSLWKPEAIDGKQLLFTQKDYRDTKKSAIIKQLKKQKYSKEVRLLTDKLIEYCNEDNILNLEPLENLLTISFGDNAIDQAYQAFLKLSKKSKKYNDSIASEISSYIKKNKTKINTNGKILRYLDFLLNQEDYALPRNFNDMLLDHEFSLIDHIYLFFTIKELVNLGNKFHIDNIIDLVKNASFEEQNNIQQLYYLKNKYVPNDFLVKLKQDFFRTLANINMFIQKNILERTLKRSTLSRDDIDRLIEKLQNSNMSNYKKTLDDITQAITNQYIIPVDYQDLIKDNHQSVTSVISSCYSVKDVEKIGDKIGLDNIVDLAKKGTYHDQKNITTLNNLEDKFIPKDFNRMLQNDFYGTIEKSDNFFSKKEFDHVCHSFKMSKENINKHKNKLNNCKFSECNGYINRMKEDLLDIDNYSDDVKMYYSQLTLKNFNKNNYLIINFLKDQVKKLNYFRLFYKISSMVLFVGGVIVVSDRDTWMIGFSLALVTVFFYFSLDYVNKIPNKFMEKKNNLRTDSKVFSDKINKTNRNYMLVNILFTIIIFIYSLVS